MKIYNVLIEYKNFEDLDNNYTELLGSYVDKEDALACCVREYEEQIDLGMKLTTNEDYFIAEVEDYFNENSCMEFEQKEGYGESKLSIIETELKGNI